MYTFEPIEPPCSQVGGVRQMVVTLKALMLNSPYAKACMFAKQDI